MPSQGPGRRGSPPRFVSWPSWSSRRPSDRAFRSASRSASPHIHARGVVISVRRSPAPSRCSSWRAQRGTSLGSRSARAPRAERTCLVVTQSSHIARAHVSTQVRTSLLLLLRRWVAALPGRRSHTGSGTRHPRCARGGSARALRGAARSTSLGVRHQGGSATTPSNCALCPFSSQLHTTAAHHRITREVARGTRDARAAGVRARATRWRRAPYVTGGSSSRGLGDKTLQLRPFFPIAYHHHTPPPRRSIEGGATRGIGGDPAGDVGTSGALPDSRGTHRWWPILLRFGGTAVFDDARRCVVLNGIPPPKTTRAESRHSRWHEERGARRQAGRGQCGCSRRNSFDSRGASVDPCPSLPFLTPPPSRPLLPSRPLSFAPLGAWRRRGGE